MKHSNKIPALDITTLHDETTKHQKRARRKAKIRAKIKFKLEKLMANHAELITAIHNRIHILQEDIEGFNPRFHQLQTHTKSKWVNELTEIQSMMQQLRVETPHEVAK